jgi:hypothetical protein
VGVVNPTQSNAGDTIEAADINTPINQLAAVVNGNIDSNNIAAGGVVTAGLADGSVTPAKLVTGSGSSWTTITGTTGISSGSGTITSGSCNFRYTKIATWVALQAAVTITTNGTGATSVNFTLPVTPKAGTTYVGWGRADGVSGKMVQVKNTGATAVIFNYDNSYPGANGETFYITMLYEY